MKKLIKIKEIKDVKRFWLQILQFVADFYQFLPDRLQVTQHFGCVIRSIMVLCQYLLGSTDLHASYLQQVIDKLNFSNILSCVFSYSTTNGLLRLNIREFFFPITQKRLSHIELCSYLTNRIKLLQLFIRIIRHNCRYYFLL